MIYSDNENVMKCIYNFYSIFNSSKNVFVEEVKIYLNDIDCEKIIKVERELCDKFFELGECKEVIKFMKNNKLFG